MTSDYTDLAKISQPKFIKRAGAVRITNVGAICTTVNMKEITKMTIIMTAKVAIVFVLFSFIVSAMFNCSMTYP